MSRVRSVIFRDLRKKYAGDTRMSRAALRSAIRDFQRAPVPVVHSPRMTDTKAIGRLSAKAILFWFVGVPLACVALGWFLVS